MKYVAVFKICALFKALLKSPLRNTFETFMMKLILITRKIAHRISLASARLLVSLNSEMSQTLIVTLLQLRVRATDGGYIPCTTDNVLTVNVQRNNFAPRFVPPQDYITTILETHSVLQPVYTVTATDQDIRVRIC